MGIEFMIGTGISAAGIAISLVIYAISQKRPEVRFTSSGISLTSTENDLFPDSVEILYKGQPVKILTKELVWLWNAGKSTLRSEDISSADPLRVKFNDSSRIKILRARLVKVTSEINKTSLQHDNESITIAFEFLRPNDGAIIEILHTGEPQKPEVTGTTKIHRSQIKRIKSGALVTKSIAKPLAKILRSKKTRVAYGIIAIFIALVLLAFATLSTTIQDEPLGPGTFFAASLLSLLYFGIGIFSIINTRNGFPKTLQIQEDEIVG